MSFSPLRRLIIPAVLLALALALGSRWRELEPVYQKLFHWLPYLMLTAAATLSLFFNRARLFASTLLLLAAYVVLPDDAGTLLSEPRSLLIYSLTTMALPLTLLALLFITERGLRSGHGVLLIALAPALLLAGWWFVNHAPPGTLAWLQANLPVNPYPGHLLSLRASAVLVTAFIAGLMLLWLHGGEDTAALTSTLAFVYVALALYDRQGTATTMFSVAGLNLGISLMRSSHEMAFRDELTGLLGRRALNERLKGLGRRYAIAMVDVDHFKQFNDTWGHDAGDDVLKMVARHIDAVGGGGTAYRYGGEEFSIVFPGKAVDQCARHLEELRRAVVRYPLTLRDTARHLVPPKEARARRGRRKQRRGEETAVVTVSIGLAQRDERHNTPEEVIAAADAALYRAKQKGRNCLVY